MLEIIIEVLEAFGRALKVCFMIFFIKKKLILVED